jgi:hypothetical protein
VNNTTIALHQVEFEQKSFWRNPAAAFFAFLFPIIFLVVFASLFKGQTVQIGTVSTSYDNYYIPALVAFGVMGACFTNIAVTLSLRRDNGILKRLRGTPLPPWAFLAGVIGSSIIVSIVLAVLTTGFGILVYGVHVPEHFGAAAATIAVGALSFCALGLAMTIARKRLPPSSTACSCPSCSSRERSSRWRRRTSSRRSPSGSRCATSSTGCSPRSTRDVSRRAVSTALTC